MGTFRVQIEIGDPQGQRFESVEALVDTGATNTAFPASQLRGLGVSPHRRAIFELADGRQTELEIGRTWVRVNGELEQTQVVFTEEGSEPVLGAVTLEEFGLAVDPVRRRLVPVPRLRM
jgi:clan AA aspartic protease